MARQVRNMQGAIAEGLPASKTAWAVMDAICEDPEIGNNHYGLRIWVNSTGIAGVRSASITLRDVQDQMVVDKVIAKIKQHLGGFPYHPYTHQFWFWNPDEDSEVRQLKQHVKKNCIRFWYASEPYTLATWGIPRKSRVRVVRGDFTGQEGTVVGRLNWGKQRDPADLRYTVALDAAYDSYTYEGWDTATKSWIEKCEPINHSNFKPEDLQVL